MNKQMRNINYEGDWNEMCPIYCSDKDVFEQIGTGVLINIFDNIYLLTASHVTDVLYVSKSAKLMIPTIGGFSIIGGVLYHRTLNKNRDNDKIDFSFYKLSPEMVKILHDSFIPLQEHQIDFSDDFVVNIDRQIKSTHCKNTSKSMKTIYSESSKVDVETINKMNSFLCDIRITFAGYPCTKSKYRNGVHNSEIVYYHGRGLSDNEYNENSFNKTINVLSEFGKFGAMDNDFNVINTTKQIGISGGGVYKTIKTDKGFDRKLIGIGHTYKKQNHLFVGTNIGYCINIIKDML